MGQRIAPRTTPRAARPSDLLVLLPIKIMPHARNRFRAVCVTEDKTYAEMLDELLDVYEDRQKRQLAMQKHPLDTRPISGYPGGSHTIPESAR
jgi:hypothetical protein